MALTEEQRTKVRRAAELLTEVDGLFVGLPGTGSWIEAGLAVSSALAFIREQARQSAE